MARSAAPVPLVSPSRHQLVGAGPEAIVAAKFGGELRDVVRERSLPRASVMMVVTDCCECGEAHPGVGRAALGDEVFRDFKREKPPA